MSGNVQPKKGRDLHSFYERAAVHQQYTEQSLTIKPIRLAELLRWGEPPVTKQKLIESAEFLRAELPKRLAKRVLAIQQLPVRPPIYAD